MSGSIPSEFVPGGDRGTITWTRGSSAGIHTCAPAAVVPNTRRAPAITAADPAPAEWPSTLIRLGSTLPNRGLPTRAFSASSQSMVVDTSTGRSHAGPTGHGVTTPR